MIRRSVLWIAILTLILTGCFSKVERLPALSTPPVFATLPEPDPHMMVGLALSGGGSRAATFAAGVLEALGELKIKDSSGERSLLERVQYISSVSGGSLATAYYAALKPPKSEPVLGDQGLSPVYQKFFSAYKEAMQKNFEWPAALRQVLLFRAFNQTKFAYSLSEVWDDTFFGEMTFAGLYERERRGDSPRVILNGTSYNSGLRFMLTTLPPADFDYDFVGPLIEKLKARLGNNINPVGLAIIVNNLETAKKHFLPLTFEQIGANHRDLRLSLGVATSASFPPIVGPITYSVDGNPPYQHIGDGGLFDNLGTESLATLFLKKIPKMDPAKRGIIIVVDAAYSFDAGRHHLDQNKKGFEMFLDDPSRIVGVMEQRANAYQLMLWDALRTQDILLPDFPHLRVEILKYTEAKWSRGYQDVPKECRDEFPPDVTPEAIRQAVGQIPTRFQITPCHGALLIAAAHQVVQDHRERIVKFLEVQP
jgi:predicted acylesterase/phospholipase RssA